MCPLLFKLETPEKMVPQPAPLGRPIPCSPWVSSCNLSLGGTLGPSVPFSAMGQDWHLFLLTSDDSEPYSPGVTQEEWGLRSCLSP
jgi:hypothetical protein